MAWRLAQKTAIAIPPTPLPKGGAARRDVAAGGGGEGTRRKKEGVAEVAVTVRGLDQRVSSRIQTRMLALAEARFRLPRTRVALRSRSLCSSKR